MERWLQQVWYGGRPAPWLLRPLALLFGALVSLRRWAFAAGLLPTGHPGCPVIVVGNLTVGGTGKTPLTIWLVQALQQLGLRPGVVLRGHGGSLARLPAPTRVTPGHTAAETGDEALLIARRTGCAVAVGRDRVAAARLLRQQGAQLVLADDGLQHLRLARDLELVVIDGERGFGNGWLLPAGPLRESLSRLQRVPLRVQNGGERLWCSDALRMEVAGKQLCRVDGQGAAEPLAAWRGREVHAVAAIGNPRRFFDLLTAAGLRIRPHVWPDHHPFSAADLAFADALPVLMTEKDAVKCHAYAQAHHWTLPVEARFEAGEGRRLLGRVLMEARLLDLLVCPLCKGPLIYDKSAAELLCRADRLAFPIRDGIPVMLEEEAHAVAADDPRLER